MRRLIGFGARSVCPDHRKVRERRALLGGKNVQGALRIYPTEKT